MVIHTNNQYSKCFTEDASIVHYKSTQNSTPPLTTTVLARPLSDYVTICSIIVKSKSLLNHLLPLTFRRVLKTTVNNGPEQLWFEQEVSEA